ncbi:hypothetical protein EZI54_15600 [Marinobacter halodurans]|uniref:Uncharacterized protein n=1 Tax=Marinobacter halodurans TaxID=2528979 RepID=A0ABY1ZLT8_9GAMM|nr:MULTISPECIES: hypothetical protein [Marinobacter]ROT98689.1 hypothetical protein EB809_13585 [Marinobacter sp. R17]TBW52918.1 hypothetical protein EZI54_15600 [Marinobacter halodurans]
MSVGFFGFWKKGKDDAGKDSAGRYRVDKDGNAKLNLENEEVIRSIRAQLQSLKDFEPDRKTA